MWSRKAVEAAVGTRRSHQRPRFVALFFFNFFFLEIYTIIKISNPKQQHQKAPVTGSGLSLNIDVVSPSPYGRVRTI